MAAAFGRLCVETVANCDGYLVVCAAAFGRLCVETKEQVINPAEKTQPPSGGCVLKHKITYHFKNSLKAAAFGRLCVETTAETNKGVGYVAAAFGRLCVETL